MATYPLVIAGVNPAVTYYVKTDGSIVDSTFKITNMAFYKEVALENRIAEYSDFYVDTELRTKIYGTTLEELGSQFKFYSLGDSVYEIGSDGNIRDMSGNIVSLSLYADVGRSTSYTPLKSDDMKAVYTKKSLDGTVQGNTYMIKQTGTGESSHTYLHVLSQYAASYINFETASLYYDGSAISDTKYRDIFGVTWVKNSYGEFMVDTVTVYTFDPTSSTETPIEIKYDTTTGAKISGNYPDQYYMKDQYGNHVVGNYLTDHKVSTLYYEKPDGTVEKLQVKYVEENEYVKFVYKKVGAIDPSTDKPDYYIKKNGEMVVNNDNKTPADGTLYHHIDAGFIILSNSGDIPTSADNTYSIVLIGDESATKYQEVSVSGSVVLPSDTQWKVWGIGDSVSSYSPKGADARHGFIVLVKDGTDLQDFTVITVTKDGSVTVAYENKAEDQTVTLSGVYKVCGTTKTATDSYSVDSDDALFMTHCVDRYISDYSIQMVHAKYNQRTEYVANGNTYLRDAFGNIFEDWLGTPVQLSGNRGFTWTFLLKEDMDLTIYTKEISYNIYFIINGVKVSSTDLNRVSTIPTIDYSSQPGVKTEFYGTDIPQYTIVAFDGPENNRGLIWYTDPSYSTEYDIHNAGALMSPTDFQPDVSLPDAVVANTATSTGWKLWGTGDVLQPVTTHKPSVGSVVSISDNYFYVYTAAWTSESADSTYNVVLATSYGSIQNNLKKVSGGDITIDALKVSGKTFQGWKVWNVSDSGITYNSGTGKYTYTVNSADAITVGDKKFIVLVADWGEDLTRAYNIIYATESGDAPNMESVRKYQFLSTGNISLYAHYGTYVIYLHDFNDAKQAIMYQLSEDENRHITIPSDHFSFGDYMFAGWGVEYYNSDNPNDPDNGKRVYTYVPEEKIMTTYLKSDVLDLYPYFLSDGSIIKYYDGKETLLEITLDDILSEKQVAPKKGQALVVRYSQENVTTFDEDNSTASSEGVGRHVGDYHTYYLAQMKTPKGLYSDVYNEFIVLVDDDTLSNTTVLAVSNESVEHCSIDGNVATIPSGKWKAWGRGDVYTSTYTIKNDDKHNGFVILVKENYAPSNIDVITITSTQYVIQHMMSGATVENTIGFKVWDTGFPLVENYIVPTKDTSGNTSDSYSFINEAKLSILQVDAYVVAPSKYMREGDGVIEVSVNDVTAIGLIPEDYTMSLAEAGGYGTSRTEPGVTPTKVIINWNGFVLLVDENYVSSLSTYSELNSKLYNVVKITRDPSTRVLSASVDTGKAAGNNIDGHWIIWGSGSAVNGYTVKAIDATLPDATEGVKKFIVLVDENVGSLEGFTVIELHGATDNTVLEDKQVNDLITLNSNNWYAWGNSVVSKDGSNRYTLSTDNAEGFMWDKKGDRYYFELDYNLRYIDGSLVIYSEDSSKHEYVGYS